MAMRDVLWETEKFDPREPDWYMEGTGYTEDGDLIAVRYNVPPSIRRFIMEKGRVPGGVTANTIATFQFGDQDIIRLDRPGPGC